jgi:hypothetical protein
VVPRSIPIIFAIALLTSSLVRVWITVALE